MQGFDSKIWQVQEATRNTLVLLSLIHISINESKLNLNPLVEGRSIRLPIPALTEERRKDLVKLVKSLSLIHI